MAEDIEQRGLFQACLEAVLTTLRELKGPNFDFKDEQVQCLFSLFCKKDVLAVMPTGFGKSLIFQSLVLLTQEKTKANSFVLVIVPLKSIIADQVMELQSMGITACSIGETNLDEILSGSYSIVYGSAESVTDAKFIQALKNESIFRENLAACVVDETHTIQTWGTKRKETKGKKDGKAFRAAFGELSILRSFVKEGTPFAALTGTADECTVKVVKETLLLRSPFLIKISPNRENIRLSVLKLKKKHVMSGLDWLIDLVKDNGMDTPKSIIFCNTMNDIACIVNYLMLKLGSAAYAPQETKAQANCLIAIYHSNSWEKNKKRVMDSFKDLSGKIRVIVATSALSMGVNFPNVRHVVNFGPARSVLDQHQEIGRAGRDGLQSHSLIVYHGHQLSQCEVAIKDFVKSKDCLRVAAYKTLDSNIQPLQPPHLCCKNCSSSCSCGGKDCQSSAHPLERVSLTEHQALPVPQLSRPVADDDLKDLREALLEIKQVLSCGTTLLDAVSSHGFSDQLVDDVVENCHRIFTVSDVLDTCPIFSLSNAIKVLEVIQEIFMDIPNFDESMDLVAQGIQTTELGSWNMADVLDDVDFTSNDGPSSDSEDELPEVLS